MRASTVATILRKLSPLGFTVLIASGLALGQIGYVRSDGINSVVYNGNDSHIYELFLLGDGWHSLDLTALAGAPPAASLPVPYVRSDGINSVVYSGQDYHIYELYNPYGGNWYFGDLTALSGAPLGLGAHPYVRSDGINSVVYVALVPAGEPHQVYELYLSGGNWHFGDLTALSGAPPTFGYGAYPYVSSNGTNSVLYIEGDSHENSLGNIYELYLARGRWRFANLTALSGAPLILPELSAFPHPYVTSAPTELTLSYTLVPKE